MRTKRLSPRDLIFSSLDQVRFFSFTSVGGPPNLPSLPATKVPTTTSL